MYRRGDPRWNRTIQHITDNLEHANESAQENIYGFTQSYISPCFSSLTQCVNACTAPCFPSHNDRRRHRGRSRGRAESSFDFYDDWEEDENDGLLGWGNDNLDRLLGGGNSSYGATTQPARQSTMTYGQRSRDPRYNTSRRKSAVHDVGTDPTIIPSSSYFGFLGRLPFKIGGKGLRYKPSAADLVDHPGAIRRTIEEQPLIEDSDEDAQDGSEYKGHRRQRSGTHTSGHTTDSFSSRGDIFPSEDELDDAVPLDDEFAVALERRTTGQWNDESSSHKDKARSSSKHKSKSKRPSASRISSRTASSRNTRESSRQSTTSDTPVLQRSTSDTIQELTPFDPNAEINTDTDTLADLQKEEERLRVQEETAIQQKRQDAHNLAVRRGLHTRSPSPSFNPPPPPPQNQSLDQTSTVQTGVSPLLPSPASESTPSGGASLPGLSGSRTVTAGAVSVQEAGRKEEDFVPAKLPSFGSEA